MHRTARAFALLALVASISLAQSEIRINKSFTGTVNAIEAADGNGIVGNLFGRTAFDAEFSGGAVTVTTTGPVSSGHADLLLISARGNFYHGTGRYRANAAGTVNVVGVDGDQITNAVRILGVRPGRATAGPPAFLHQFDTTIKTEQHWLLSEAGRPGNSAHYATASDELFDLNEWRVTVDDFDGDPGGSVLLVMVPLGGGNYIVIDEYLQVGAVDYGVEHVRPLVGTVPPGHDVYITTTLNEVSATMTATFSGVSRHSSAYRKLGAIVPEQQPTPEGDTVP
jgi:hypothetical protein